MRLPSKPPAVPMPGQIDVAHELAVEVEDADLSLRVLQIAGNEAVADDADATRARPSLRE